MDGAKEKLRVEDWVRETEAEMQLRGGMCLYQDNQPSYFIHTESDPRGISKKVDGAIHSLEDSPFQKRCVKEEILWALIINSHLESSH